MNACTCPRTLKVTIARAIVPAVHYPAPGGPSVETLCRVFRRLAETGHVVEVSLSSWAPELDEDGRSQETVIDLLQVMLA